MSLSDFLLARIAEDESAVWHPVIHDRGACGTCDRSRTLGNRDRVLAQCAAIRRVVESYWAHLWIDPGSPRDEWGVSVEPAGSMMRALASAYADHPDYDDNWRL